MWGVAIRKQVHGKETENRDDRTRILFVCLITKTQMFFLLRVCKNKSKHLHLHLADVFIQSDLQMRTMEAIKINKRAMICKCYDKSQLA